MNFDRCAAGGDGAEQWADDAETVKCCLPIDQGGYDWCANNYAASCTEDGTEVTCNNYDPCREEEPIGEGAKEFALDDFYCPAYRCLGGDFMEDRDGNECPQFDQCLGTGRGDTTPQYVTGTVTSMPNELYPWCGCNYNNNEGDQTRLTDATALSTGETWEILKLTAISV